MEGEALKGTLVKVQKNLRVTLHDASQNVARMYYSLLLISVTVQAIYHIAYLSIHWKKEQSISG